MAYTPNIPNEANLVRGVSGDLTLMRENFQALDPIVSGHLLSGSVLRGWRFGDSTQAERFRATISGADPELLRFAFNSGNDAAPVYTDQFVLRSGGDAEFTVKVSGIDPTAAQHLTTKAYVDTLSGQLVSGLTLSGLSDTAVSGAASGNVLTLGGGGIWGFGPAGITTIEAATDTDLTGRVSGHVLIYDGAQWVPSGFLTVSGLFDTDVTGVLSGQALTWDDTLMQWTPASIPTDHGALTGLADDDHTQYVPTDASRGFTSQVSGLSPLSGYHLTTKDYVDQLSGLSVSGATTLSGLLDTYNGGAVTPLSGQALVFDGAIWTPGAAVGTGGAAVLQVQVFS